MKVRWSEDADRDRDDTVGYIWNDNPSAARRMDALFDAATERLADFPWIREGAVPGTREFIPHPNDRMVYEVAESEIVVHALIPTSRRWPPVEGEDA